MRTIESRSDHAAFFCSYRDDTPHPNFASQFKNLQHHYTHQHSRAEAKTFWSGFGAVRSQVFHLVGGFDKSLRFMEDVDLGYRLHRQGHRIRLCPSIQVTHHKRYTLASLVRSDLFQRAIPWTLVMLKHRVYQNDLNTSNSNVICLMLVYLALILLLVPGLTPGSRALFTLVILGLLAAINHRFLRFAANKRGIPFAIQSLGMLVLQYLYSGFGVAIGVGIYAWRRLRGR